MDNSVNISRFLLKYSRSLAFIGLWFWLAIFQMQDNKIGGWGIYLSTLLVLLPTQTPGLFFSWYRTQTKANLKKSSFKSYWAGTFLICLPALTACSILLTGKGYDQSFFIQAAIGSLQLELLLMANEYYLKKVRHSSWVNKIGFEKAVLMSLLLLAVFLSAMAVSSIDNPDFHSKERLLIGFIFVPAKFINHFWLFLSFTLQFTFIYLCGYLFFFINSRLLVSIVLKQKGIIMYLLSVLATVSLLYPIIGQLLILMPMNQFFGRDIFSLNPFLFENGFGALSIMILSLPIVLALQWGQQNTRIISLEKEKSQTELDLLKQQLNPHFFFNTLNNLYALSLQKSDKTSNSILQLSELMRYTIYKGQQENVTIDQEIKYIEDYIDLQQIRLKNPLSFKFEKHISSENLKIAPLLFIVLIENAFKHGIEPAGETAFLSLHLQCDEKELKFICENSFDPDEISEHKGIGLDNLKKRLELLYPNRHSLDISSDNGTFKTTLQLKLS